MTVRHLLDITDLGDDLRRVMALARRGEAPQVLRGKGVALVFEKPSNRTRHSTEMAVVQLGGHPIYTRGEEIGFDTRESVEDITRVMAGYHALLAARVVDHDTLVRMAAVSAVPVVNLLSDRSHPLQAIADVLAIEDDHGPLAGQTVAWVGDYNNVARSLAEACLLLGAHVSLASPHGYHAEADELSRLAALAGSSGATVRAMAAPHAAVHGAIAVCTDSWVSMGQEAEKAERHAAFAAYTVDRSVMEAAAPNACFYHCMPVYRGLEAAGDVVDGPRSRIIPEAHQRLNAARGALALLAGAEA